MYFELHIEHISSCTPLLSKSLRLAEMMDKKIGIMLVTSLEQKPLWECFCHARDRDFDKKYIWKIENKTATTPPKKTPKNSTYGR